MEMEELREELIETIQAHYERRELSEIKLVLNELNPADIAEVLEDFPNQRLLFFRLLSKENAAETFVELDPDTQETLLHGITDTELREVLDEIYIDDAVDIIEEMPATMVKRILKNTDSETRRSINALLKYPEDSAGSIMTPEYVDLKKGMTVEDAFKRIRRTGVDKETIYTCYVTDDSRHLLGVTTVKELLLHEYDDIIEEFMETNVIYVNTLDDQELAAQQLSKYDFLALPVVDMEERLVGIITVDDALDVIQEENTEDIQKMNAMLPTEKTYLKTTVFETWKSRFPWLLLLMVSATFTGSIITGFEEKLATLTILTAFIPMLMDTGGNSGGQASVTIIRAMSLGEVAFKDYFRVVWKEVRVGLVCGLSLAAVNFVKIWLVDRLLFHNSEITLIIDVAICLTLVVEIVFAKFIGCSLPMLAKRVGFDPAVMSSPFITTIVDAVALLLFFGISSAVIPQLH
ncbi:MAG: magnesium transporter [Eubacterium sp.]|nr:magnesium transporter [Eubacterium sp.]